MRLKRSSGIREIVQTGNPVLRSRAAEVDIDWIGTKECQKLIDDMVATMRDAPGVGLAAPQIGIPMRIFVVEDRIDRLESLDSEDLANRKREEVQLQVFINPTLEHIDETPQAFYEGCLSVSGFVAEVERSLAVRVRGLNEKAQPVEVEWSGWPARILQHEFDHLEGTLYLDRMATRTFTNLDALED